MCSSMGDCGTCHGCNRISAPSTLERRGQPLLRCRRKAVGATDPGWARLVGVMSSEPYTRDKCRGHFSCHSQRSLGKTNKAHQRQGEERGVKVYKIEFTIKFLTCMSSLSNALCKGICDTFQINTSASYFLSISKATCRPSFDFKFFFLFFFSLV